MVKNIAKLYHTETEVILLWPLLVHQYSSFPLWLLWIFLPSNQGKLDITPDDPRWIGAWWGGFLLCGALLFLSALFMFGFPQALDEQDMDSGAESEQAMLPSSMSLEFQGSKPNGAIHGFDINSGLSVCQHLRGEEVKRRVEGV